MPVLPTYPFTSGPANDTPKNLNEVRRDRDKYNTFDKLRAHQPHVGLKI